MNKKSYYNLPYNTAELTVSKHQGKKNRERRKPKDQVFMERKNMKNHANK